MRRAVFDANLAWRFLAGGAEALRKRLATAPRLLTPRFLFVELFKHKQRLLHATRLPEPELLDALHVLVARLEFADEALIPLGTWAEAYRLCRDVDEKDTPYVALSLHAGAPLWTLDVELKEGLRRQGFDHFFEPGDV